MVLCIITYDFQSNNDMHKLIQEDLLLLKQWYSSYGLTMNCSKTEYIVFSRKECITSQEVVVEGEKLKEYSLLSGYNFG